MPITTEKLCFFHMPRTGGTWVQRALEAALPPGVPFVWNHHFAITECDPETWDGRVTCTFVRQPFDWLRSWFAWQQDHKWKGMSGPTTCLEKFRDEDFEQFTRNLVEKAPRLVTTLYEAYTDKVDMIGNTARAREDLIEIMQSAGEEFDPLAIYTLPIANASHCKTLMCLEWNIDIAHQFYENEREIFERFFCRTIAEEVNDA